MSDQGLRIILSLLRQFGEMPFSFVCFFFIFVSSIPFFLDNS